mgnify:CR=1 FL=1
MERKQNRKEEMLSFLSQEDKNILLSELLDAINISIKNKNVEAIKKCLEKWDATIEMISIPGMKERVWERFEKLKERGCIH